MKKTTTKKHIFFEKADLFKLHRLKGCQDPKWGAFPWHIFVPSQYGSTPLPTHTHTPGTNSSPSLVYFFLTIHLFYSTKHHLALVFQTCQMSSMEVKMYSKKEKIQFWHLQPAKGKAYRILGFLMHNLHSCSQDVKEAANKWLIHPALEYGSLVWDPPRCSPSSVQKPAVRFVTGTYSYETVVWLAFLDS